MVAQELLERLHPAFGDEAGIGGTIPGIEDFKR
jgi:hypothetical protein